MGLILITTCNVRVRGRVHDILDKCGIGALISKWEGQREEGKGSQYTREAWDRGSYYVCVWGVGGGRGVK